MKGTPKSREGQNLLQNWGEALAKTMKHFCDPNSGKGKDDGKKKLTMAQLRKIDVASQHGLTAAEKDEIDRMSMEELRSKYGSVLSDYRTYMGTGYFNPMGSPKNRYIIFRYQVLQAMEEARVAQKLTEQQLYYGFNQFEYIRQTGYHPSGRKATKQELEMVNSWWYPWLKKSVDINQTFSTFYMT